jgi:2-oxoglutarate ferredoxin oxidoreductase subunit alpha
MPDEAIRQLAKTARAIIVPEMNLGQYVHPVREAACEGKTKVLPLLKVGGEPFSSGEILEKIREVAANA